MLSSWIEAFQKAGGREIFLVLNLDDLPQYPPFAIVPLNEKSDARALGGLLVSARADGPDTRMPGEAAATPFETSVKLNNVLFAGAPDVLARVKGMTAAPRPEIAKAFAATGDTAAQFLFLPTDTSRRMINQLAPQLPLELGGQPSSVLTEGFLWGAVGVDSPPRMALKLIVQSQDAKSAEALQEMAANALSALVKQPQVRQTIPNIFQLTKLVTPEVKGDQLVLALDAKNGGVAKILGLLKPAISQARGAAVQQQGRNNLKQIALAMHNFHDTFTRLPAAIHDADKKPLLSWRVQILPFIDQAPLYNEFHQNEPWDSPHNKKLIERMPDIYRSPASKLDKKKFLTTYLGVAGKQGLFGDVEGISFRNVTDGLSNTIMVLDVADEQAVIWTKPDDFTPNPENPLKGLIRPGAETFEVVFGDGAARALSKMIAPETLKAIFTYNGGEVVGGF
jgi:hypothetical protein